MQNPLKTRVSHIRVFIPQSGYSHEYDDVPDHFRWLEKSCSWAREKSNTLKTEVGSVAIRGSEWGRGRGSGLGWSEMDWLTQRCSNRTQHSVRCCHYCCCSRLEKLLICSIWVRIQFDFHRARTKKLPAFWKFAANSAESQSNRKKTAPMTVKMLVHLPFTWMTHIAWPKSLSLFCFLVFDWPHKYLKYFALD